MSFVVFIWNWGHLEIGVAIVDGNTCAISARRSPNYIYLGKGTNVINSTKRAFNCAFMNVETPDLSIWFTNPNF